MKRKMLDEEMKKKFVSYEEMAKVIGRDLTTFYRKMNGENKFNVEEVNAIRNKLNLSNKKTIEIFLD